ncbi:Tetratricopeptide-like helical domain containing protein [Parasponia andersonii]|uniref:Tetratricopeptide-like helical domain containing protein n=1 Tax=Parasponia andersonii TaxID=3476 RepID=A0A2P5CUP2_PARAD|nr:Tetratricopeptide-like helical domain containing protein [Parasponia andersonii]
MIFHVRKLRNTIPFLVDSSKARTFIHGSSETRPLALSSQIFSSKNEDETKLSELDIIVSKVRLPNGVDEIVNSLVNDEECNSIKLTRSLVVGLLHRFKDDWKSALGVFKWAESRLDYEHNPDGYDLIIDVLGKMKQMETMMVILQEMGNRHLVTLNTVAKVMRRFAGSGQWENAVKVFDELGTYGLEKNTESMNLLLDTLCKACKVEQAREIFLELKRHIVPNAHTFNIFIHGWCKIGRVDEAQWTIEEMKGHGCRPCVISYSTIVKFYCCQENYDNAYDVLDEMRAEGCSPNTVTYTTVMSSLAKSEKYDDALLIAERMKSDGCKLDTLFYNSLIHILGRAGRVGEAINVFEVEMPRNSVLPNTSTYNTMVAMFCYHNQEQKALNLLAKMESSGVCKPDVQTYNPLLKACIKNGKTDDCFSKLLDDMVKRHHLSLDMSTYTLLVHGLCRANKCEWAYLLFQEMIGKGLMPRYKTCRLLFEEVKEKHMYDVAEKIEDYMKKM